jgi:DNA-binding transcriptional LysR family regulator
MEWQQLRGFCQVAKLGSFTKAAEATFRTQSALSQQVKALEDELGSRLLERLGKRRLKLTSAGEKLLACAQGLLAQWDALQDDLRRLQGRPQGPLSLAAPFTTLYHLFPGVLQAYPRRFPQVRLSILDRSQKEVIDLVRRGDIDFGLALESLAPGDLAVRRWQEVEMVLMTPREHPLARLKLVTVAEICRYPLILPPRGQPSRQTMETLFQKQGLDYRVVMESSNVELSSLYVELGLGISFATITRDFPRAGQRSLTFLPMSHYVAPDFIAVILRQDKTMSTHLRAFLDLLFVG